MHERSIGSNVKKLLMFLVMLYPILPLNYYILGISYANICSLLIVLIFCVANRKIKLLKVFKYNPLFWLYLVVFLLFAIFSGGLATGIAWLFSEILVTIILIQLISTEKDFNNIIHSIINGALLVGLIGISESILGRYWFQSALLSGWSSSYRYGVLRCTATFGHPINFAFYLAIAALLVFYRLNDSSLAQRIRIKYRITYLVCIAGMLFSVSRLPIVFFIVCQMIMILSIGTRKFIKYVTIAALIIAIGFLLLDTIGFESLALVNDLVVSILRTLGLSDGGSSNVIGFGNRFELYAWVVAAVGNNYWFGNGFDAAFSHQITSWLTKSSIEVHYLYVYFRCGIVGLTTLVLGYIGTLRFFGRKRTCSLDHDKKLPFIKVLFLVLIIYYVCLFGVQETDLTRIYCELVAMGIGYYRLSIRNAEKVE